MNRRFSDTMTTKAPSEAASMGEAQVVDSMDVEATVNRPPPRLMIIKMVRFSRNKKPMSCSSLCYIHVRSLITFSLFHRSWKTLKVMLE